MKGRKEDAGLAFQLQSGSSTSSIRNNCSVPAQCIMAQWWNMALLLLWMLIFAHLELLDAFECPLSCTCSYTERFIGCSNASLSSVPTGLPHFTTELDLRFNHFDRLPATSFPGLPELTSLYLGSSRVHRIEPGTFQGMTNLHHLYLDNNLLEEIPVGTFENLTNLVFLHLQHNCITSLSPGAFSPLKRLSVLYLSHNLLTELSDVGFSGLQQLYQLHLSANLIVNLSAKALPRNLRTLFLDWNRLKSVPVAIGNSARLSVLHLSGNPIKEFTSLSSGRKLGSLKELFLESLDLEDASSLSFKRLRRLEVLSLRNNSLESLPSLSSLKYLSTLYLTGNKWCCDCNLIWLRTWQKKVKKEDRSPVECSSPSALHGQQLVNVELQKLTCPPFHTVPDSVTSSANMLKAESTTSEELSTTIAITFPITVPTTPITNTMTSTAGPTAHNDATIKPTTYNNRNGLENHDPCLSDHISNISTRSKGNTVLEVTWSFSGDHDQFEIRCTSSVDQHILRVIGRLTEVELHHLQPGTNYRVCVIPQNENLLECEAPAAQQCTSGHTATHTPSQHFNLVLGISVSFTVLVLIALAAFASYRWWLRPIQFQRYYNEDRQLSQHHGIAQFKVTKEEPVYESLEDDQHIYMTAASQWPEENIDCRPISPSRFPSTPTYVSL
nr:chondroadherin-like protein [Anolis sagrei ordinatus]